MKCLGFFLANNLLAPNQSGFKPGGSCLIQLLSVTHEIYSSFDDLFEVRKSLTHQSVISYRVRDLTNHFFT